MMEFSGVQPPEVIVTYGDRITSKCRWVLVIVSTLQA